MYITQQKTKRVQVRPSTRFLVLSLRVCLLSFDCFPSASSHRLESIQQRRAAAKQANRDAAKERKEREAAQAEADRLLRERNNIAVRCRRMQRAVLLLFFVCKKEGWMSALL